VQCIEQYVLYRIAKSKAVGEWEEDNQIGFCKAKKKIWIFLIMRIKSVSETVSVNSARIELWLWLSKEILVFFNSLRDC